MYSLLAAIDVNLSVEVSLYWIYRFYSIMMAFPDNIYVCHDIHPSLFWQFPDKYHWQKWGRTTTSSDERCKLSSVLSRQNHSCRCHLNSILDLLLLSWLIPSGTRSLGIITLIMHLCTENLNRYMQSCTLFCKKPHSQSQFLSADKPHGPPIHSREWPI